MHTRRAGAFLVGAWLLGGLLVAFVSSQALVNIDRFFHGAPPEVSAQVESLQPELVRQIFRFQAAQLNRHLLETWEAIQLGLGAALLATAFFAPHRSRIMLGGAAVMLLLVAFLYFYLTPTMNTLARGFDFVPAGAAVQERLQYETWRVWHRVLDILKTLTGAIIAGRLLFDRHEWQEGVLPGERSRRRPQSIS